MELKVGQKRSFSFLKEPHEIIEILDNSGIKMLWKWTDMVCPHCQKKIEKFKEHIFNRIELLVPVSKSGLSDLQKRPYLIIIGFDQDGRVMLLPREKHKEVFSKSKRFKKVL